MCGIGELAGYLTYGRYIPDSEMMPFLDKHLNDYELNDVSWRTGNKMLYTPKDGPYIASCKGPLSSWNVQDYGRIFWWSKSSKRLNAYFNVLPKPPKKSARKLTDL